MIIIKYRNATINDINEIYNLVTNLLENCNINKKYNNQITKEDIFNENKEEIIKDINNYYVCEVDNHIVGACGVSDIKHDNIYNIEINNYREILYLIVDDNYQRKGIGTELLKL